MIVSLIVAVDQNNGIGKDNALPWHLPADLRFFKQTTKGHLTIMGRKTWEAIGSKPLPSRPAIVITRQEGYWAPAAQAVVSSLDIALQKAQAFCTEPDQEVFVIGGAEIYALALPQADRLYLTRVAEEFVVDTYFPDWQPDAWQLSMREAHAPDEKNHHAYTFHRYDRPNS